MDGKAKKEDSKESLIKQEPKPILTWLPFLSLHPWEVTVGTNGTKNYCKGVLFPAKGEGDGTIWQNLVLPLLFKNDLRANF